MTKNVVRNFGRRIAKSNFFSENVDFLQDKKIRDLPCPGHPRTSACHWQSDWLAFWHFWVIV